MFFHTRRPPCQCGGWGSSPGDEAEDGHTYEDSEEDNEDYEDDDSYSSDSGSERRARPPDPPALPPQPARVGAPVSCTARHGQGQGIK